LLFPVSPKKGCDSAIDYSQCYYDDEEADCCFISFQQQKPKEMSFSSKLSAANPILKELLQDPSKYVGQIVNDDESVKKTLAGVVVITWPIKH
jgi:hypothetical protein